MCEAGAAAYDKNALANLWDSVLVRRQVLGADFVPGPFQFALQLRPRLAFGMALKVRNVLKDDVSRFMVLKDAEHMSE